jgi:hypothetical protein
MLLLILEKPSPEADADAKTDFDKDEGDDCDSSFTNKSGCLRNRKYTQSKWVFSSIAAIINASTIFNGGGVLLVSEEEKEEERISVSCIFYDFNHFLASKFITSTLEGCIIIIIIISAENSFLK